MSQLPIKVGISACLLGQRVRYDGGHKRSAFCVDELGQFMDFKPFCPEVAVGLSIPRPPIRLVEYRELPRRKSSSESSDVQSNKPAGKSAGIRAVGAHDESIDVTDALKAYGQQVAIQSDDWCGFIFMQKSPSCGLGSAKKYLDNGYSQGVTTGLFAEQIVKHNPLMPVEEAGRLNDAGIRENFLIRVFALNDWRQQFSDSVQAQDLVVFHSRYKYLVMAYSQLAYRELGHLIANLSGVDLRKVANQYWVVFMRATQKPTTRGRHANVLLHLKGYLKNQLSERNRLALEESIEHYKEGIVPLIVPLTLLKHHLDQLPEENAYACAQAYLQPYPYKLGLRNCV